MDYFYQTEDKKEIGPVDEDILIARAKSGEINSETLIRNSMVKSYKPASKIACLENLLDPSSAKPSITKKTKNLHRSESSITTPSTNYRFLAFFIDIVIISILGIISFNLFNTLGTNILGEEKAMSAFLATVPILAMTYYAFSIGMYAQTFGYWFFGIMAIKGKGEEVFVGRAFFMSFFFILTLPLAPLFIFIFTKGLHEALSGTRVVNVKMG